jgi:hypothetical protein
VGGLLAVLAAGAIATRAALVDRVAAAADARRRWHCEVREARSAASAKREGGGGLMGPIEID